MSQTGHPISQPSLDISPIWIPIITAEVRKLLSSSWKPLIFSLKKHPEHDARSTRLGGHEPL
jgi:hypothetical protein